jgi:hypothetical protein
MSSIISSQTNKLRISRTVFETGYSSIDLIFLRSGRIPRGVQMCPSYSKVSVAKTHFSGWILKFIWYNLSKIACNLFAYSSIVVEKHTMSSNYTKHSIPFKPIKITSMHRRYVAGALFSPSCILTNWKLPPWHEYAVFSLCSGFIVIW